MTLSVLALPLLAAPFLVEPWDRGRFIARLAVLGLALGSLDAGAGSLGVAELGRYAAAGNGNALFVSLSVGLVIGALAPWPRRRPIGAVVLGIPVVVGGLVAVFAAASIGGLLLGVVLGALPMVIGPLLPARGAPPTEPAVDWWWQVAALVMALAEPLLLMVVLPLPWLLPLRRRWWPDADAYRRLLPAVALVSIAALLWLALTVAGDPLVFLTGYGRSAPLSAAAGRLLAVLAYGVILALLAPWPLGRLGAAVVPIPALVVVGFRFATQLAPQGMEAWYPTVAMILALAALVSAFLQNWRSALAAIAVLGAMTGSTPGLVAGLVLGLVALLEGGTPTRDSEWRNPVTFQSTPLRAASVAVALAVLIAVLIEVEVVIATVLAAGIATALARSSRRRSGTRPVTLS